MDDNGIFFGLMKFAGDGGIPYALFVPGTEKSSIPSFKIMPVLEIYLAPNLKKKMFNCISLNSVAMRNSNKVQFEVVELTKYLLCQLLKLHLRLAQ